MAPAIKVGTVMMKSGTNLPMTAQLHGENYSPGWKMIKNTDGHSVDRNVRKAGWSFFFLAPNIHASAWGAHDANTISKAMRKILAKVKSTKFNCLEVTEIAAKKFMGIPYVEISGHSRHIQNSLTL
jgi:endo-1,4-beta-D-glucanase Y